MQSKKSRLSNFAVMSYMNSKEFAKYVLIHMRSFTRFSKACLELSGDSQFKTIKIDNMRNIDPEQP